MNRSKNWIFHVEQVSAELVFGTLSMGEYNAE
jgi:hypothetical protein